MAMVKLSLHCILNNDYQQDSRVLYTFVPNKSFDQLFDRIWNKQKLLLPFHDTNNELKQVLYRQYKSK